MRLIRRIAVSMAAALLLAACAAPVPYQPRLGGSGPGYSDEQLAANRWRVTFTGNSATKRQTVENYLLLRAAEVARQAGYRWFVFDSRDTEAKTTYQSDFAGWPGWRGRGWYRHSWPYDGVSDDARPITTYEAYAEIVLLSEAQAKNEPRAMQAEDVIAHVSPQPSDASKPPQASKPAQ